MTESSIIKLDRGSYGDEGHFVQIDGHPVFIKDDTGTGANGRGGSFTKHGLEKKLMKHHESRGGFAAHEHRGAMADDSGGDLMGKSRFTFHKTLPGEVRKHIENNPAARKLFRVSANAADAKGADALASMGDKYFQMADEAAGGHMTQAIESARKSDDPEARFHAAMYAELPKTKVTQGLISPDKLREGHNFTVNGRAIHVVNDNGTLTLDGGSDWPSTPVQAMSEIPIDKHSLKMGKKAMSVEKEVIPFSRTIELSQGALFDKTDTAKGTGSHQGHLYGGKEVTGKQGDKGHYVTIHGSKLFIKHGQSVGAALREHFGEHGVTRQHVAHAASQIHEQGGKANVEPKDVAAPAKDIKRDAVDRASKKYKPTERETVRQQQAYDTMTANELKAAGGTGKNWSEMRESLRGAALTKPDETPAAKPETVPGDTGKIGSMHPDLVAKPTARDTIDAAKGGDETPDSYDFTRTESRDIRADAAKRAKNAAFKAVGDPQKAALLDKGREFTYGDVFKSPDGKMGYLKQGDSPSRVKLVGRAIGTKEETLIGHYDRAELTPHMRVYSDTERKEQMNTPESVAASAKLRKDAAAKAGSMDAEYAKQAAEQDAWAKSQTSAGEAAKKKPLKDALSSIVDESGNITRGGDFIRELASGRTDSEVQAAHEWSQKHASAPVRRVIGDVLAGEIRARAKTTNTPGSPLAGSGNANQGPVTKPSRPQPVGMDGLTRDQRKAASKPQAAPIAVHPKAQEAFDRAASSGDVTALKGMLYPENKGLRQQYEKLTGWTLPKTVKGTHEFLDAVGNVQKAVASGGATDSAMQGMNDLINKHGLKKINLSRAPDEITAACVSRAMGRLADRQRDTATLAQLLGM